MPGSSPDPAPKTSATSLVLVQYAHRSDIGEHTVVLLGARRHDRSVIARTVTILFTDVVGSTELAERLGPQADEFRSRHFAALRDSIDEHRGTWVKSTGDGVMAAFAGAADALACAARIQRDVAELSRRHPRHRFGVRVGVSAGDATERDSDYFGTSVIQASRLCDGANGGQVLVAEVVRLLSGSIGMGLNDVGELRLRGLAESVRTYELNWRSDETRSLRVALADDSVLLRKGIAELLEAEGIEVVAQADDAEALLEQLDPSGLDVVVIDVRMPPTYTTEGLDAAVQIRTDHPKIGVLVLSQTMERRAATRLLEMGNRVGYLLKDRVTDPRELSAAIRTIASGGCVIDPEIAAR
ncbi:MAG: response regulator [Actinomycetota bacterium]